MSAALTTNVDMRLLRTTKFPPEFNVKVDMTKINTTVIKKWVTDELARILQNEDDVVTELVSNIIEETRYPNIKELQISLTGFLDKDAAPFCTSLWKLCLSAQDSPQGIPKELLQAKAQEIKQQREEEEKFREEAIKQQEVERERERELARIRERGRGRGGRNGRDYDRRPPRDSRSPPPRRRRDDDDYRRPPPSRGTDTYIPSGSGRRDHRPPRRRRSPSYGRSSSRSRSPPQKRRNLSRKRSRSRHRDGDPRDRRPRGDDRPRSRSPPRRRRSPSPKRDRRRASSSAERSRSPPTKRARRQSPARRHRQERPSMSDSRSSGRSPTPPRPGKMKATLSADDLMAAKSRQDVDPHRLSRSVSE